MTSVAVPPSKLARAEGARWRFEPIEWVGRGATAEVWRARDLTTGRNVALKIARDETSAALLAAEAERLSWALSSNEASAWRATLVDLGLAVDANLATPAGGTLRYMPPELWVGARGGDGRARDRFALGLVVAEVLVPDLARSADFADDARRASLP